MDPDTVAYMREYYPDFRNITFKPVHLMVREHLDWLIQNRAYNVNYKQPSTEKDIRTPDNVNTEEEDCRPDWVKALHAKAKTRRIIWKRRSLQRYNRTNSHSFLTSLLAFQ